MYSGSSSVVAHGCGAQETQARSAGMRKKNLSRTRRRAAWRVDYEIHMRHAML